jgi:uncharacterized protein
MRRAVRENIPNSIGARVSGLNWATIAADLDARGFATTGALLEPQECAELVSIYDDATKFRSRVIMARHGFGRGEYQYFSYPLPDLVGALRAAFYARLAQVANRWADALRQAESFPPTLDRYLRTCHQAGQTRPTPLLLRYGQDDYNCLHQDLYGDHVFPLQATILLNQPDRDFTGGEFVLVEQRPRMQSRPEVVRLARGEGVIFAVHHRPVAGTRGVYRVNLRHGVSRITAGARHTLGVIFHDAK